MVKASALTFMVGIFKGEQRKAPFPQICTQAHTVLLMKLFPLTLARAVTGNNLQNKTTKEASIVGYLTSNMKNTSELLALKGQAIESWNG